MISFERFLTSEYLNYNKKHLHKKWDPKKMQLYYRKSLCRNPLYDKKSIIFRGSYDKGYKVFIADENLFICFLIYLYPNLFIITIKCWKLKWRGVWGGSWSLFYLLISFLVYRWRKFIPWSWNWLQQSSSFMGRAILTTASTAIVFIFIINSVLIKSYSIS